ncbi:MAG: hypothetical protein LBI92_11865 [Azoarcus sp.]|jgi:SH3-like domain-containing protein|nr:hypothetical protein [Azoarcus sp.]
MSRIAILAAATLSFMACSNALAIDYLSVSRNAILYDNASPMARKLAIVRAGTPVEFINTTPNQQWMKVRVPGSGGLLWIEASALERKRTVIVTAEQAAVRREANTGSPAVFEVVRDVVLDLVAFDATSGWVQVRHADGSGGYLYASEVWGL